MRGIIYITYTKPVPSYTSPRLCRAVFLFSLLNPKLRQASEIFVKNRVLRLKLLLFCAGFAVELVGQAHFLPFHLPLAKFFIIL